MRGHGGQQERCCRLSRRMRQQVSVRIYLAIVILMVAPWSSCKQRQLASSQQELVQVMRDPYAPFAEQLRRTTYEFALTRPHVSSGKGVIVGTNEGGPLPGFAADLPRLLTGMKPEIVILRSESDLPSDPALAAQLGKPEPICGTMLAYMPAWVPGPKREATEMYLHYLQSHCK
jgi:hypothetical protein